MQYDGMRQPFMQIPILPEKEGYVIDYGIEDGWPYYISTKDAAIRKSFYDHFMSHFQSRIKGEPRKGIFEIFSTIADSGNDGEEFRKLWMDNNK